MAKKILKKIFKIVWNVWGAYALLSTLFAVFYIIARPNTYIAGQMHAVNDLRKGLKVEKFG